MRAIDPIDRIALMEKLGIGKECTVCEQNSDPYCKWKPDVVDVCEAICTVPTIEPRCETCEAFNKTRLLIPQPERKTGRWGHYEGCLTCSECGIEYYDDIMEYCGDDVPRFCPNCGADMRGKN